MEINGLKRLLLLLLLIAGSSLANAELRVDGQWILVETQRVGRTEFTYTYRAEMVNRGADRSNVRASLSSTSPHTEVIDGHLHFGDVPSGARVLSSDTFRFRHDRLHGFNPGALRWTFHFAGKESSPDSDSEGEENRDRDSGEDDTQNEPVDDTSPDPDHPNTPDSNVELPPDPRMVAPPVEKTVATDFAAATAFLYTGSHPIQTGVAAGTIKPQRAAVLRGRVQTREGRSLSGVTVTVLNHAEYGQTLTREDGMFDLAVNGGRSLVVCYEKAGFLPVQRSIGVPWRDYTWLPDVVMIPLDNQVTTIDLTSSAAVQVARGSPVSDADGSRQATLLFIQGTTARMEFPDGSTQALPELSVRATEYTVGPSGPIAMPGELPPASGYTYAVELSVDQALTAGANTVRFSHPVLFYLENFLNFPVGETVPVGWYDRTQAAWLPADNGRIISILGVVDGLAVVDIDGKGQAADAQTLARWGITDAERAQLVDLYRPGQSLWRVSIDHFTSIDCNWPFVVPDDARGPSTPPPNADSTSDTKPKQEEKEDDPCEQGGSIVECQNQVLGESLWLTGTPFSLQYRSDRVVGRRAGFSLTIPLSGSSIPASLARIDLDIQIAGLRITRRFPATTEQSFRFRWNGKDGYGRTLWWCPNFGYC